MRKNREFSLASIERILRKAGAQNIQHKAIETLANILEEIGLEISKMAIELCAHSNRKRVTEEDIKMAYKYWRR